mmetsp:Transcript_37522/g.67574  ORF Transcript_37522/g.67574 Transcript_37522/m.67574 type:complete len:107 (-) Transcript_37522:66-386(-)
MAISPLVNTDRKGEHIISCYNNSSGLLALQEMHNTNSHDCITYKQLQRKQLQHAKHTIATIDGSQAKIAEQAGSQNIPQKDMELLNSLETDMIFVCIRCTHNLHNI